MQPLSLGNKVSIFIPLRLVRSRSDTANSEEVTTATFTTITGKQPIYKDRYETTNYFVCTTVNT